VLLSGGSEDVLIHSSWTIAPEKRGGNAIAKSRAVGTSLASSESNLLANAALDKAIIVATQF
jgi:hypothetical protein